MKPRKVLLFDIDGTLLKTGFAGFRSLNRVFSELYGISDAVDGIRPDGKTDPLIIREILAKTLPEADPEPEIARISDIYVKYLKEEIYDSPGFTLMPGVAELLPRLSELPEFLLGVATGNLYAGAAIKLQRAGLDAYFHFGGYGSDSEDRAVLLRAAIARAEAYLGEPVHLDRIYVIGDTPRDILCGKAVGVKTVAVATGRSGVEALTTYNPDHVFCDLADIEDVIKYFLYD